MHLWSEAAQNQDIKKRRGPEKNERRQERKIVVPVASLT
jgi:hypothetical protein